MLYSKYKPNNKDTKMFTEPKQFLTDEERKHALHDQVDFSSARYAAFNATHAAAGLISFLNGLKYMWSLMVTDEKRLKRVDKHAKMIFPRARLSCQLLLKLRDEHGIVPKVPEDHFNGMIDDSDLRFLFTHIPYFMELDKQKGMYEIVRLISAMDAMSFNDFFSTRIGYTDGTYANPEYKAYIGLPILVALAEELTKMMDEAGIDQSTEFDLLYDESHGKREIDWSMKEFIPEVTWAKGRKELTFGEDE